MFAGIWENGSSGSRKLVRFAPGETTKTFTIQTVQDTVFEGDVINGYTSPDAKKVVVKFFSNDRGYTAGAFNVDLTLGGVRATGHF